MPQPDQIVLSQDHIMVILEALLLLPSVGYVFWGRPYRRRMILGFFTSQAIADYFLQFWPGSGIYSVLAMNYNKYIKTANSDEIGKAATELEDALFALYNRRFGWSSYMAPVLLLGAVLYFEGRVAGQFAEYWLLQNAISDDAAKMSALNDAFKERPDHIVVAALAGAYLIVGSNLVSRAFSLSLLPSDLYGYALRLALAPGVGYILSTLGKTDYPVLLAFVATAIPIADLLSWVRSLAAKSLNVTDSPQDALDKLICLPGVDGNTAARFQDQGISTIKQLRDGDPVQLSMRTGLDFAYVVNLVDQAVAWGYFDKTMLALNRFGWTGASDILDAARILEKEDPDAFQAAAEYCKAEADLEASEAALRASDPADPGHADLVTERDGLMIARDAAKESLFNTLMKNPTERLINSISQKSELNLDYVGLRNAVTLIGRDSYVKFIWRLMRDTKGTSFVKPKSGTAKMMDQFATFIR